MPSKGKLVLFGAGKIGRSFIGQLFSRSGYEVVFIDINQSIINELNHQRTYKVIVKSENSDEILEIKNVRGIHLNQSVDIADEIADASVIAISVGQQGLADAIKLIAQGIIKRHQLKPASPIDIIIAENMRNADAYFKDKLKELLPQSFPLDNYVGLVETSIGKMVPLMTPEDIEEDILQVFAEPYNTLILDKKGFKNPIPEVSGLAPKENMKAWVDRKSFIHNLGHATVAYIGHVYDPSLIYLWQALKVKKLYLFTRATMMQSAKILVEMYLNEFSMNDLESHIDDLLKRFQNKALGDTIFRVGCDLPRKLSREDRLFGAILQGFNRHLPYDKILFTAMFGFYFKAVDSTGKMHPADVNFHNKFNQNIQDIFLDICNLDSAVEKEIVDKGCIFYDRIGKGINFDTINE